MTETSSFTEVIQYSPVEVRYTGNINPASPPLRIDGNLVSQAVRESNYPPSVAIPIVITDSTQPRGELANFNALTNKVTLSQKAVIDFLRRIREREHEYLDSNQMNPGRLERFLSLASNLLNPITAPYALLGNKEGHIFSGNQSRRHRYLDAAKAGFEVNKNGQSIKLSKEVSVAKAKYFMDSLIEKSAPWVIGWILAHEYEHKHLAKAKVGLKASSLLAPLFGAIGLASTLSSHNAIETAIVGGTFLGVIAGTLARSFDEKISYDAGEKNFAKFAKAVSINHDFFQKEVLDKPLLPAATTKPA